MNCDEWEQRAGELNVGSTLISDIGPDLKRPRNLPRRRFPFGFQREQNTAHPDPPAKSRFRDTVRRGA